MSGHHRIERARRLLALPDGWLEAVDGGYALRTGPDRRARVMLTLDEAEFRALVETPGLVRRTGGWKAQHRRTTAAGPAAGRPGSIEGPRFILLADGQMVERQANLTTSAVTWLASRLGEDGRPWLTPAEVAAAEQLGLEAEAALRGPGITMRWDALPRTRTGGGRHRSPPGDAAMAAARRVEAALVACGTARAMVRAICIDATPLQAAEQALGLRRRTGKATLKQGLGALARHYRLA